MEVWLRRLIERYARLFHLNSCSALGAFFDSFHMCVVRMCDVCVPVRVCPFSVYFIPLNNTKLSWAKSIYSPECNSKLPEKDLKKYISIYIHM